MITDYQGAVIGVTDAFGTKQDQIVYDAYGQITSQTNSAWQGNYTYAGMEYDTTTGLFYDHARYYNPQTGSWMSQDPLGFSAGDSNLTRYVNNSPNNGTDPTGTELLVPVRIVVAYFAKLSVYGFWSVKVRFAELLRILEEVWAMEWER